MGKRETRENQYIRISNRVKLRLMKQLLTDLVEGNDGVVFIDEQEYIDVYNLIDKWIETHSK